jgi:ubiquinone biosynthesis protein COQ9
MSQRPTREQQRDRLLEAALVHVPFDGWSRRSLLAGARDLGVEVAQARRLFPRGGDDLLAHLDRWADREMLARIDQSTLESMRMRDRIAALVRARLEALTPHREAVRRSVAARLLPTNALTASGSLWRTLDIIWTAAGDRARDASYYTKRTLLGAVWSSTFFYWLDDRSPGQGDSWAFLDRRIDNVMQIGSARARLDDTLRRFARFNPRAARR